MSYGEFYYEGETMKKIKFGIVIVVITAIIYCIISYSIFFNDKQSIDYQLQQANLQNNVTRQAISSEKVTIQKIAECKDPDCQGWQALQQGNGSLLSKCTISQEPKAALPIIMAENQQQQSFIQHDGIVDENTVGVQSYSFVTMPLEDCVIDKETQATLDTLIGHDLDGFVKIVLQSNNNIVSKEACRSCAMHALFHDIKHHKKLYPDDIKILQKLLINLYQFVEKTKKMSKKSKQSILLHEQYAALQDLNRTSISKNKLKLQARQAATTAALKKLQSMAQYK